MYAEETFRYIQNAMRAFLCIHDRIGIHDTQYIYKVDEESGTIAEIKRRHRPNVKIPQNQGFRLSDKSGDQAHGIGPDGPVRLISGLVVCFVLFCAQLR